MNIIGIIEEIGISGFLDIVFMTALVYSMLVWFKQTRAAFVVIGLMIFGAAYLLAQQLGLSLTTTVFQGFFAIILIAVVIIFQEEIKHFLEQLASRSLVPRLKGNRRLDADRKTIEAIISTAVSLAREKIGALIVVRGKDPIVRHLDGGIDLNGEVSEQLLRSLFDPHSPGHDGALIVRDSWVTSFSCHLPLSKNLEKLHRAGTRHAAALGLAELTDALCLVVSEEQGTISVARNGDIRVVNNAVELSSILHAFYQGMHPRPEGKPWRAFFRKNYREKAIAFAMTVFLWFLIVHESRTDYRSYSVPIEYNNIPPSYYVEKIEPSEVELTFSGPRRSFYFISTSKMHVTVKLFNAQGGVVKRPITRTNVSFPEGLSLENVQPGEVAVFIKPIVP